PAMPVSEVGMPRKSVVGVAPVKVLLVPVSDSRGLALAGTSMVMGVSKSLKVNVKSRARVTSAATWDWPVDWDDMAALNVSVVLYRYWLASPIHRKSTILLFLASWAVSGVDWPISE